MATIFRVSVDPLTVSRVVDYLKDPKPEFINSLPPVKPKGGEIYLYQATEDANKGS